MTERVNMATSETLGIIGFCCFFLRQADFSTENPGSPGDNCWGRDVSSKHSSTVCCIGLNFQSFSYVGQK